jgi:sugar-specific transcriptional regulator TrmB
MDPELIENLKVFGLSDYEAKAWVALATVGTGSVTEVSQLCDVPRSNLYSVLEKLAQKGLADIQTGRPVLFKAVEPKKALEQLEKDIEDRITEAKGKALKKLATIKGAKSSEAVQPALIWGIRGPKAVLEKIAEMVRRAKDEALINIADVSVIPDAVYKEFEKAKERGVKIKIVTEKRGPLEKMQKVAIVRIREKIHGLDVVTDTKEALVAPSLPIVAAWVDNPEMALHVKDFLLLVWKDAQILK